jgi:16S rRNA (uracil1498-N3)-methyltransferase
MNSDLRSSLAHLLAVDLHTGEISVEDEHHLFRVLRARDGEAVSLTNGRGQWRMARVISGSVVAETEIVSVPEPEPLEIFIAIPKADRPEWIVQKLTEIGVTRICWLHTERSVVRWNSERASKQLDRLSKVAIAAAMQSRRVWLPVVDGPVAASGVLGEIAICEPGGRTLTADDRRLAIGPEGGWSLTEREISADQIALGAGILRVETAAVVAASILGYLHETGQQT